ncbi:MAG: hypothetical protein JW885_14605 [Deltaproteobacteria bacterium]|nr:hypothetical protein [Candidatus Zymogenaceae bacterium]
MAKKRSTKKKKSSRKKKTDQKNIVILVGAVVAAVVFFGVLFNYHFLMTDDGFVVVQKESWGPDATFADTRNWGLSDWLEHPEVTEALTKREIKNIIDRF